MRRCWRRLGTTGGRIAALLFATLLSIGCARTAAERNTFVFAGDWDMPPAFHGNPWAPGGQNVTQGFVYEPLFVYVPATRGWIPRLGTRFEESPDHRSLTVHLRQDARWHDGRKFTSRDVRSTFLIGYLRSIPAWGYLDTVECPDDHTVVFRFQAASPGNAIRTLMEWICAPADDPWSARIAELLPLRRFDANGWPVYDEPLSARFQPIREELMRWHPPLPVGTGPFRLKRVTFSDLQLEKFPEYYAARDVHVERVHVMRWGSNEVVWSYLMAGEIDAAGANCPYDLTREVMKRNPEMKLALPSDRHEFGIAFNCTRPPMSDVNFRRAVACILDRDLMRKISSTYAATTDDYSLGILYSQRNQWLSGDFLRSLTRWRRDPDRATKYLEQAGFRKVGGWTQPDGSPISLEIIAQAGANDQVLLAETAAAQLSTFGIAAHVRVLPVELFGTAFAEKRYDLAATLGVQVAKFDDPGTCLGAFYSPGSQLQTATGLPRVVEGVDTAEAVARLNGYIDDAEARRLIEKLARVTNEQLPFLSVFEKNLMIFMLDGPRITGWPAADDPIWSASSGGLESVFATLMAQGRLK